MLKVGDIYNAMGQATGMTFTEEQSERFIGLIGDRRSDTRVKRAFLLVAGTFMSGDQLERFKDQMKGVSGWNLQAA